ncbi:MAG: pimeloyl-ACP methyl ester carboxylesterase [Flavobacteriales bacterium]|jgi:pimeloyl-ACP methyl ester carboxylesterase
MSISKKFKKRSIVALLLCLIGFYAGVFHVAPAIILHPRRMSEVKLIEYFGDIPLPSANNQKSTYVSIPTKDGICLSSWLLQPKEASAQGTLIFIHGIGGSKEFQLKYAEAFVDLGLNVVVFDLRAHGQSGGENCTYGYCEKHDVSSIIDWLTASGVEGQIGLYGTSLGGAIALQTAAIDDRIDFLIIESTFATLEEVTFAYMDRISPASSKYISGLALAAAGRKGGFEPDSIKPELAAAQISIPVFMSHGTADVHIPIKQGRRNFDHLKSSLKEWHPIRGADHNSVHAVGGKSYQNEIEQFILNQFSSFQECQ